MKTLLAIEGDTYLVPKTTDLHKLLELFQGITRVRHTHATGPDGKEYDSEFYRSAEVMEQRPAKVRVELVHEDEVLSRSEWNTVKEEVEARKKAFAAAGSVAQPA